MWGQRLWRCVRGPTASRSTTPRHSRHPAAASRNVYTRIKPIKVGILGVPFEKGQKNTGVGAGPEFMRKVGLESSLVALGHDVLDFGDVSYESVPEVVGPENMQKYQHVVACMMEVSTLAKKIHAEGRVCLSLGGDHSVTIGTLDATVNAHEDVAVIWVDAHADLNTPATSPSGSAHGMPVALLAKDLADYWPYLPGMDWQVPKLPLSNLAYIGLRSVDEYERLIIDKYNVCAFGMSDVERLGIHRTMQLALEHVDPRGERAIHLSFDIDALDALEAPSTGTPVRGGLTLREGIHVMEMAYNTGRLAAVDLVEVNPNLGSARDVQTTLDAGMHLVVAAFGHSRLGNMPAALDLPLTREDAIMRKNEKR